MIRPIRSIEVIYGDEPELRVVVLRRDEKEVTVRLHDSPRLYWVIRLAKIANRMPGQVLARCRGWAFHRDVGGERDVSGTRRLQ